MPFLERNPKYHMNFCDVCDSILTGLPFWKVSVPALIPNGHREWDYECCAQCKNAFVAKHGTAITVTKREPA